MDKSTDDKYQLQTVAEDRGSDVHAESRYVSKKGYSISDVLRGSVYSLLDDVSYKNSPLSNNTFILSDSLAKRSGTIVRRIDHLTALHVPATSLPRSVRAADAGRYLLAFLDQQTKLPFSRTVRLAGFLQQDAVHFLVQVAELLNQRDVAVTSAPKAAPPSNKL
ncbi:hypothetical protein AB4Z29_24770 [Paenibacillus sp. 2TAB23]|uniref:hypothetical protein n=1 Tax=Paenibacillus sp. 2TAB23 TaxID=3233004 RepID=UPI003F95D00B